MIRTISAIAACLVLVSQVANGDEIRRTAFADGLLGTWALTAPQCEAGDKQNIEISKAKYVYGDDSCSVGWIVETAAPAGTNYAVHALCADRSQPAKTRTVNLIIRPRGNDRILVGTAVPSRGWLEMRVA
ncbi:MAG: hypothetical protein K2Z80_10835 [Xanthobacteraceae bacterium]|nr:hypothetical protein [Xanthobacteraceae bacterium]